MGYCKSFFMCSVRDIGLRKANCSLHFCIQQQQGFQCVRSRILLALHLSKKLAVAACTIISSSLYSEVMLENHKATSSSIHRSCVMPGAKLLMHLPHYKGCSVIHSHGVTKEFVAHVILKQLPQFCVAPYMLCLHSE